jgi:VWFA-related protein
MLCHRLFPAILLSSLASLVSACMCLLAQEPQQPAAANPPPVIKTSVSEVLVPVVVRDAQGNVIGNLTKEDFQLFDRGKPRVLTGFTAVKRATEPSGNSSLPSAPNSFPAARQPPSPTVSQRFVIFLFDDLNLSIGDLAQVQQAITNVLDTSVSPSDMVAVLSSSGSNSTLTRDRAKLHKAISDLRVKNLYHLDAHDCPNIDYYQSDLIINKNDGKALEAAVQDIFTCANLNATDPTDPKQIEAAIRIARQAAQRAVDLGEQDFRYNLGFIRLIVSKMAALPGQRILILVSPGFLTPTADAMALKSDVLDMAARANVIISAIDARGLYTATLDASQGGGNSRVGAQLQTQYRQDSMAQSADVMVELADGTGGTFFHNSNDQEAGFKSLLAVPEVLYLLSFSNADEKPNGSYHEIKVKVDRPGITVQARRGYFAPKPDKEKK